MTEEIRQDGKVVLSSDAEHAIPMIFNNLCGKNFSGVYILIEKCTTTPIEKCTT